MAPAALSRAERSFLLDGLQASPAHRPDGRTLSEFRAIEVEAPASQQADGSARVLLGSTEVLCGVKAEIETMDAPVVPMQVGSSSTEKEFRPWMPSMPRVQALVEYSPALLHEHNATELGMMTSLIQDMIQACFAEAGTILGPFTARQFIVVPSSKYWKLHLDVYVMSWSGGNVLDAVFAAVYSALWDTRLPSTQILATDTTQEDTNVGEDDPAGIKYITRGHANAPGHAESHAVDFALASEWDDGVPLHGRDDMPVCVSVYPVRDTFLLDPTLEEESALSSSIAVLASASGRVYGLRQRGEGELNLDTIHQATEVGVYYAKQLASTLQTYFD